MPKWNLFVLIEENEIHPINVRMRRIRVDLTFDQYPGWNTAIDVSPETTGEQILRKIRDRHSDIEKNEWSSKKESNEVQ